jgi:two-component system, chemotaxis family, chemotaxis protein CheY
MSPTILVVDDSLTARQKVKSALAGADFVVVEAEDGDEALEKLAERDVSLVICDVNMERMGGIAFLEKARSDPRWASLPFVMLTSDAQSELIRRAKNLGAKGWILKPFKAEMLLAAAKKLTARAARPA